jgi:iron complex outermembrane receptor protein
MEKQMIRNMFKKSEFVRIAFAASVGLPLFIVTSAFAQNEATATAVVVTGSNIPTAEEVGANPVDTVTTADIDRSGQQDVLTVLQKRNPDFVGGGNIGNTNANIASGFTQGGAIISIRGLPTLTLLEGRRVADDAAIAVGGAQFQDVNLFPTALISRIEVLKDGASTLYGSEAVGGVVNIFLKDDFTGVDMGYHYGFSVEPGVAERKAWVIAGVGNEDTHVTAGFQYYEEDGLFSRERDYSNGPGKGGVTGTIPGLGRSGASASRFEILGFDPTHPFVPPTLNSPFDNANPVVAGSIAPGGGFGDPNMHGSYHSVSSAFVAGYDLSKIPTSTLDVADTNAYASFTHQIFGKQLEIFGDFLYTHNHNLSFLNAQPISNASSPPVTILGSMRVDPNPITNPSGTALIPENRGAPAPYNPFVESIDGFSTGAGANTLIALNRYNAFNGAGGIGTLNALTTNPRTFTNDGSFYRFLGGIKSQINKDWYAEVATYYSHYQISFLNGGLVNGVALNNLIENGNGSGIAPTTSSNPGGYLDFFAVNPTIGASGIPLSEFQTIFGNDIRIQDSYQRDFDAKIVGFPINLPGGPLGVSVGVDYRIEGFKVSDSLENFIASVPIKPINRGRFIDSVYGELAIPIVGSEMNIPGIYNLNIGLSGRYDHYEGINTDSKVPKYTLRYQPIKDLTLRGTYSNSFVAPTLYQLYGPTSTGFSGTIDFGFGTEDQAQVESGSNPNLTPATAESYTAGMVYSPHYIPGLTITVDYFRTLEQNIVSTVGGSTILHSVETLGPASPYASLVSMGNFPGQPGSHPITGPGQLHGHMLTTFYLDTNLNIGAFRVEGFDLSAHYNLDLQRWGQLELGINSVVFTKQDERLNAQSPYFNISNLILAEGGDASPDYKITFLVEHRWQGFVLSLNVNYIPEMLNSVAADPSSVDQSTLVPVNAFWTMDGRLSYTFHETPAPGAAVDAKDAKEGKSIAAAPGSLSPLQKMLDNTTLTVGCNNMFNEQPPTVKGDNSNTSLETYDPYGQFVYFEINKKF